MKTFFLQPLNGLVIRDPQTKVALPTEGRLVEKTSYWQRRVAAGDVVVVDKDRVRVARPPQDDKKDDKDKDSNSGKAANKEGRK